MSKHPISAAIRLVPSLLWSCAGGVAFYMFVRLLGNESDIESRTFLDELLPYGFVALAIYSFRKAFAEFKEAKPALIADKSIQSTWPTRGVPPASRRFPLSDPLQAKLRDAIGALEKAGVLESGEASIDDAIDCAETCDDFATMEFYEVMHVLRALGDRRDTPFRRLTFFPIQVEVDEAAISRMIREFARLAGQSDALGEVSVKALNDGQLVFAREGDFPTPNAKVEFALNGQRFAAPFVMYGKNLPIGLFDELAKIFGARMPARRFVSAYCDLLVVALIDNDNVPVLERYFPDEFEPYASR